MPEPDKRLDRMEQKIDKITEVVTKLAVQSEQITTLQTSAALLFEKCDKFESRTGDVEKFQAACPKEDLKTDMATQRIWLWGVTLSLLLITIGALMHGVAH